MIRILDLFLAAIGLVLLSPLILLVMILGWFDTRSPLFRQLARAMNNSPRLIPVPVPLLRLAGRALGKQAEVDRLAGSLQIDSSPTRETLGWNPLVSVVEGIRRMVQG